jgi:hypothetical protein
MFDLVLRQFGFHQESCPVSEFLAFKETLQGAKAAGLSVGDYIDRKQLNGPRTPTDQTIDGMAALGVFNTPPRSVCEIGPGSGRYLERVIARSHPAHYEIYETAAEWRDWLVEQHGVVAKKCDGRTLCETASASIALVQSHKLFPALPFLVTVSYFQEIARVVQRNGWVVFDIVTERCCSPKHMQAWFEADTWSWPWSPQLFSRDFAVKFFADRGISLLGGFLVPLFPGVTECLIFRKYSRTTGLG